MTETNIPQPPPAPPPPPPAGGQPPQGGEESLREELARSRKRNKVLVAATAVLGTIFVLAAGVGYVVYTKISAATDNIEQVFQALPAAQAALEQQNKLIAAQGVQSSTFMPVSSLGLFSGGLPAGGPGGEAGLDPQTAVRTAQAMLKYADRPIVKEFIADLKRNPDTAKAIKLTEGGNPLEVFAAVQNARGMDKLAMKYASRPEFLSLMMEVMADPEMKPLMQMMPQGVGMPPQQPAVRSVNMQQPAPPPQEGADRPMTLDMSEVSGTSGAAPVARKRVPRPVDSD